MVFLWCDATLRARTRLVILGLFFVVSFLILFDSRDLIGLTVPFIPEKLRSASEKWMSNYNYIEDTKRLNAEQVEQDDPGLVRLVKHFYLHQPSVLPYNITDDKRQDYSQGGQSKYLDTLLNQMVSLNQHHETP